MRHKGNRKGVKLKKVLVKLRKGDNIPSKLKVRTETGCDRRGKKKSDHSGIIRRGSLAQGGASSLGEGERRGKEKKGDWTFVVQMSHIYGFKIRWSAAKNVQKAKYSYQKGENSLVKSHVRNNPRVDKRKTRTWKEVTLRQGGKMGRQKLKTTENPHP